MTLFRSAGCASCSNTGYKGRLLVCETMEISDRLRQAILRCASREEIWKIAAEEGMETLRRCALRSALEGLTSLEESLKVSL